MRILEDLVNEFVKLSYGAAPASIQPRPDGTLLLGFRLSTQKRHREKQDQLGIPEEVHDDLVWRNMEYFFSAPFPPGPGPKFSNIRTGVSHALGQTEVEVPESQRHF